MPSGGGGGGSGGVGSMASFMPGDWSCPSCGDHQFARNLRCRQCGEARPKVPLMAVPQGKLPGRRSRSRSQDKDRSMSRSRRRRRRKVKRVKRGRHLKLRRKKRRIRKKPEEGGRKRVRKSRRARAGSVQGGSSETGSSSSHAPGVPKRSEAITAAEKSVAEAERALKTMQMDVQAIESRMVDVPTNNFSLQEGDAAHDELKDHIAMAKLESETALKSSLSQLERSLREDMDRKVEEARDEFTERLREGCYRIQEESAAKLYERERWLKEQAARHSEESKTSKERQAHAEASRRLDQEQKRLSVAKQRLASLLGKEGSCSEGSYPEHGKSSASYSDYSGDEL